MKKFNSNENAKVMGSYAHATTSIGNGFNISFNKIGDVSFRNSGFHNSRKEITYYDY